MANSLSPPMWTLLKLTYLPSWLGDHGHTLPSTLLFPIWWLQAALLWVKMWNPKSSKLGMEVLRNSSL